MSDQEIEFQLEIQRLISRGERHNFDLDDLDEEIEAVCDELELSLLVETRQLQQIQESQRHILSLITRGDAESLFHAASEANAVADRIATNSL